MYAETPNLIIRDLAFDDWPYIHAVFGDRDTMRWTTFFKATEAETKSWVQETITHNNARPRFAHNSAIALKDGGEVIGWIGFGYPYVKGIGDRSFGYARRKDEWNQGYMTEALTAILHFCFSELQVNSVFGECQPENPASARVMEKAGVKFVGTFPAPRDDGIMHHRFIAFRDEWLGEGNPPWTR
jgi:[ribosomal protein S5]-alanine N-acetyltransferase